MKRTLSTGLVALLLLGPTTFAGDAKDLTLDEVIAKYVEAMGGRAKLDGVKTVKMTGKSVAMGMEMPVAIEYKRPDKMRVDTTYQGMAIVQAYDGKAGWMIMPLMGNTEPQSMPEELASMMAQQADFEGPLVDYKKKGHKVELIGKEEVEGTQAYKIKVVRKDAEEGELEHMFIDAEHFLEIKTTAKNVMQGMEIESTTSQGDYKEAGGLMWPFTTITVVPQGTSTVTFEKVEVNVEIPDERFTMAAPKSEEKQPEPEQKPQDPEPKEPGKADPPSNP